MDEVVVRLRARRHVRIPSASAKREAAKSAKTSNPISDLALERARRTMLPQWGLGMPRERHPLTVESDCASIPATSPVPPSASMIESQVQDASHMSPTIVRTVRTCQGFATRETTFLSECGGLGTTMDSPEIIRKRLIAVRYALGYGDRKQSAFADAIGLTKNAYNPFETGDRVLTFETACLIRKRFGVSIDYLFFGNMELAARQTMMELGPTPAIAHGKPNKAPPVRATKRVRGGSTA